MNQQSRREEVLNTWSHACGVVLGIIGLIALIIKINSDEQWGLVSVVIYGLSLIILFLASTLYHAVNDKQWKHRLRVLDHISIYLLIAGTYTPVLLITLKDSFGLLLLIIVWGIAAFGSVLKLFFTGRFEVLSLLLYLAMGWLIVFDFSSLTDLMHSNGLLWLTAGGLFYTVGIVFYAIRQIPYNHAIWHCFVLAGAISHFFMIYNYVI